MESVDAFKVAGKGKKMFDTHETHHVNFVVNVKRV